MVRRSPPLPDVLVGAPFDVAAARALGVGRTRLRSKDLSAPFHGIRVPAANHPDFDETVVYAARMPERQFFSHTTAARVHGICVPDWPSRAGLHVSVWKPARAPKARGLLGHSLTRRESSVVIESGGLQVLDPLSTWCTLASLLNVDELVVAGDSLVRRKRPAASMHDLERSVASWSAAPGAGRLRAALARVRPRTDSPMESILRIALARAGLPEPEVNGEIVHTTGRVIALGDLVYRRFRVVVEYNGDHHRTDPVQYLRDIDRHNDLAQERWQAVRVNASRIRAGARDAVSRVHAALVTNGWPA